MLSKWCTLVLALLSFPCIKCVVSLRLPSNVSLSNSGDWNMAIQKGRQLFHQLQSGCSQDKENPVTVPELLSDNWKFNSWPPQADPLRLFSPSIVRMFQWTTGNDYYVVDAERKGSQNSPNQIHTTTSIACVPNSFLYLYLDSSSIASNLSRPKSNLKLSYLNPLPTSQEHSAYAADEEVNSESIF